MSPLFYNIFSQGIIDMNRNGSSANFFSYVCNGKKIKELFTSTLNKITSTVRCASFIIVVLNAKLARLTAAQANKKSEESAVFLLVETHKHVTSIAVLRKKRPFSSYPAVKHSKHSKFAITDIREKPVNVFLLFNAGVELSLRNNFENSGSFAKVSAPVQNCNSLILSMCNCLLFLL